MFLIANNNKILDLRTILSKEILDFLDGEGIPYQVDSHIEKEYTIASIFYPVDEGVYFFTGDVVPDSITKSLLLVNNKKPHKNIKNENICLFIDADPQITFYKLLSHLYKSTSTGKISSTSIIDPEAKIGNNVQIDHFTIVGKATIGDDTIIRSHCYIHDNAVIGTNVTIEPQSIIGAQGVAWIWNEDETEKIVQPQLGGVIVKDNSFLGANTIIVRGSIGCRIGHGTQIGDFVHFANNVVTAGNISFGDYCFVGSSAVFRPKVKLHSHTIVGAGAVVVKNTIEEGKTLVGIPAVEKETKAFPSGMPKLKKRNNA